MNAPTSSNARSRFLRAIGFGALVVLFALALAQFPREASAELRDAGGMALDYVVRHGGQLGATIETLGGPLGGLAAANHSGQSLWPYYWWQLGSSLALGAFVTWFAFRLRPGPRTGFLLVFLSLTAFRPAAAYFTVAMLAGGALIAWPLVWWEAIGVGLLLGGLSLVEAPLALIAGLASAAALAARSGATRRPALVACGTLAATLLIGWRAAGQSWAHLLPWLMQGAAALPGREFTVDHTLWTPAVGFCGLIGTLAAISLSAPLRGADGRTSRTGWITTGFVLVALWIFWLRCLGHLDGLPQNFFVGLFALAFGAAVAPGPFVRSRQTLVAVAAAVGVLLTEPRLLAQPLILLNSKIVENTGRFADRRAWQRSVRDTSREVARVFTFPVVKATVGAQSVDLLADAIGFGLLAELHYAPRPTVQSITAGSVRQFVRNGAYYAGPDAPDFVAQRLQGWGRSIPAAMDPTAQLSLYYRYEFLLEDNSFLLWRRRDNARVPELTASPAVAVPAQWDQAVALPTSSDGALWVRVDLQRTWLGKLRQLFWPGGAPTIRLRDKDGNVFRYLLPTDAAQTGLLLQPFFRGEFDIAAYQAGLQTPALQEIALEADASVRAAWDLRGFEWRRLPPVPSTGRTSTAEALAYRYRAANRLPQTITTDYPPAPVQVAGKEALLVNPEGSLVFPVLPGDTRVSGEFGLVESAYTSGNFTDGVEFLVEHYSGAGEPRVLMRRFLDPLNEPRDRGSHRFEILLPQPATGRLVLRTTNPPNHTGAFDWSYWSQLRFE